MTANRWECKDLGLVIVTDGDDLVITKGKEKHRARASRPGAIGGEGVVYRHPSGGELVLPPAWQVTTSQLGVQLVPPDLAYTPQGPAEIFLVIAQPMPGVARAEDPRILLYLDGLLRKLVPTLGAPSAATAAGPGVAIRWTGQNGAQDVLALALVQIANGAACGLVAIGDKPRVEAREAVLATMFASYKQGQTQRDPALVGTWHYWYRGTTFPPGGQQAQIPTDNRRALVLAVDGTALERSSQAAPRAGTWSGGDGLAVITWADGSTLSGPYQVGGVSPGRRMILAGAEWAEGPSAF